MRAMTTAAELKASGRCLVCEAPLRATDDVRGFCRGPCQWGKTQWATGRPDPAPMVAGPRPLVRNGGPSIPDMSIPDTEPGCCVQCGQPVTVRPGHRPKAFCSDAHRKAY